MSRLIEREHQPLRQPAISAGVVERLSTGGCELRSNAEVLVDALLDRLQTQPLTDGELPIVLIDSRARVGHYENRGRYRNKKQNGQPIPGSPIAPDIDVSGLKRHKTYIRSRRHQKRFPQPMHITKLVFVDIALV